MLSSVIKFFITAVSFAPLLLIYWVVVFMQRIQQYPVLCEGNIINKVQFYIKSILFPDIHLLFIFIAIIILFILAVNYAKRKLTISSISINSVESSDSSNITPLLFSYFLPALKFFPSVNEDVMYLCGFIAILLIIVFVNKNSYNSNPVLWALGYRHYKVQTNAGVSLLMLSKDKIIDPKQVTNYIQFTDYLILNIPK